MEGMECHQWRLPRHLPQLPQLPQLPDKPNGTGLWVAPWMSAARNPEMSRPWPKWRWRSWTRQVTRRRRRRRSAIWRRRSFSPGAARGEARRSPSSSAQRSFKDLVQEGKYICKFHEITSDWINLQICHDICYSIFANIICNLIWHRKIWYTDDSIYIQHGYPRYIACIDLHRPEDGPIAYPQRPGLVGSGASSEPSPAAGAEADIFYNILQIIMVLICIKLMYP